MHYRFRETNLKITSLQSNKSHVNTTNSLKETKFNNNITLAKTDEFNCTIIIPNTEYIKKTDEFTHTEQIRQLKHGSSKYIQNNLKQTL